MLRIKTKTLSLFYDPREDRMKLIINKNEEERMEFWITRRFYFSLLFELETFLEKLNFPSVPTVQNKKKETLQKTSGNALEIKQNISISMLEDININFIKESENFVFTFKSKDLEAQTVFEKEEFLNFYTLLKGSFPKGEWGII